MACGIVVPGYSPRSGWKCVSFAETPAKEKLTLTLGKLPREQRIPVLPQQPLS